jgi:hypothetical protein
MSGGTDAHAPPAPAGRGRAAVAGTGTVRGTGLPSPPADSPGQSSAPVPASQPNRHGLNTEWPLRDFTELPPLPRAVPYARARTRQVLREWGLAALGDTAGQVVSELVANSLVASQAIRPVCPVRLWLRSDRAQVLVLVADASPRPPTLANPDADAESGRGLLLVEAMSNRWSWYTVQEDGMAKVVWAEFRVPAEDGRTRASALDVSPSAPPQGDRCRADVLLEMTRHRRPLRPDRRRAASQAATRGSTVKKSHASRPSAWARRNTATRCPAPISAIRAIRWDSILTRVRERPEVPEGPIQSGIVPARTEPASGEPAPSR